jgi:hypothetical protein
VPSSQTSVVRWTRTNSVRGRTSAPDAPTVQWRTTKHADSYT